VPAVSNTTSPFSFEGNEVRVVNKDGEPWFCAKDVCEVLGYSQGKSDQVTSAVKRHCKQEGLAFHQTPTAGGQQQLSMR
jgi:prophage antirepressor-like protein